jgi:hypothetical protein
MSRSPSISPAAPDDADVYLVLNDFGGLSRGWPKSDERTDRETVITDLMTGQYSDPMRVIALNTAEGWLRDVSESIADEIIRRSSEGAEISASLEGFLERHGGGKPARNA